MRVSTAVRSDVGRVRKGNEDAYLIDPPLYGVADGMGGHLAGDIASATAVETITEQARSQTARSGDDLAVMIREANSAVWTKSQGDPALRGMGTTCTLLMIEGDSAHLAHVGDSRAYLLRDGELSQLTEDHTLVARMVREGRLTSGEAENHPQRSIITRALGVEADVEVDTLSLELRPGDRILLCSDGLTSMINDPRIRETLTQERDAQAAVDRLIELANQAGGEDNITAVLVDLEEGSTGSAQRIEEEQAPSPPPRTDTDPAPSAPPRTGSPGAHRLEDVVPRRGRWVRPVIVLMLLLLLLGAGAVGGYYLLLNNSYFVGRGDGDVVTIYRGVPEEIAGIDVSREERRTDIEVSALPDFLQGDVTEGIPVSSLEDAEATVDNLRERAEDREFGTPGGDR